jgi:hypothetical protein
MKKLMIAAIFLIATGGTLSAQTIRPGNGTPGTNKKSSGYVDASKNTICDNYENNTRAYRGKGQKRDNAAGYGRGNGQCPSTKPCNLRGNGRRG